MATRLYPIGAGSLSTYTPKIKPSPSAWATGWNFVSSSPSFSPASTIVSGGSEYLTLNNTSPGNQYGALLRFITDPLTAGQSFSGATIKGQFQCSKSSSGNTASISVGVTVVDYKGTKVATLLNPSTNYSYDLSSTANQNRTLGQGSGSTSISLSSYTTNYGDMLVIEIGFYCNSSSGSESLTVNTSAGSDLPVNNTQITAGRSWVEFSNNLTFVSSVIHLVGAFVGYAPSDPDRLAYLAASFGGIEVSSSAKTIVSGHQAASFGGMTAAFSLQHVKEGRLNATFSGITGSWGGQVKVAGRLQGTFSNLVASFAGLKAREGYLRGEFEGIVGAFSGKVPIKGRLVVGFAPIVGEFLAFKVRGLRQDSVFLPIEGAILGDVPLSGRLESVFDSIDAEFGFEINAEIQAWYDFEFDSIQASGSLNAVNFLRQDSVFEEIEVEGLATTLGRSRTVVVFWERRDVHILAAKSPEEEINVEFQFRKGINVGDSIKRIIRVGGSRLDMLGLCIVEGTSAFLKVKGGLSGKVYKLGVTVELRSGIRLTAVGFLPVREF